MSNSIYDSLDEVLKVAKTAIGKTVEEINVNNRDLEGKNKGVIGQIVEEGVFGYPINSRAEPDFDKLGIELKVTGIKRNKNKTFSAKERLILNVIDYCQEAKRTFETSSFWHKSAKLLLMIYYYNEHIDLKDFKIVDSFLFSFPPEDLKVIKNDYEIIHKKIMDGQAHLISEADTMYLVACTKGADHTSLRKQPFSNILAKQRAFALKSSYMTSVLRARGLNEKVESILTIDDLQYQTFEMAIEHKCARFINKAEKELCTKFGIHTDAKSKFERIAANILGVKGKLNNCSEILKANIIAKTVRINKSKNGGYKIIESMSLPAFKFNDLVKEDWETSPLRTFFYETKFMFILFEEINNEYCFKGIKFWNMPMETIDCELHTTWKRTQDVLNSGDIIKGFKTQKDGKIIRITNFPHMKDNGICHVRPHGRNALDIYPLPVPDKLTGDLAFTKQSFWLNNSYVLKILGYKE